MSVFVDIKERWRRFRQWQQTPVQVPPFDINEQHVCLNCEESYNGHYCPRCGQSSDVSRLNYKTAARGFMDVWGMGSRGLFNSIYHLLARPGYMIADYLHGRRQPYFPPFKMFFVLTAIAILVAHVFNIDNHVTLVRGFEEAQGSDIKEVAKYMFATWLYKIQEIMDYNVALTHVVMVFFCTMLFRMMFPNSPRMGKLTVSEHFYALIMITSQQQFIDIVLMLTTWSSADGLLAHCVEYGFLIVTCRQLYGYSWVSTILRLIVIGISVIVLAFLVLLLLYVLPLIFIYYFGISVR